MDEDENEILMSEATVEEVVESDEEISKRIDIDTCLNNHVLVKNIQKMMRRLSPLAAKKLISLAALNNPDIEFRAFDVKRNHKGGKTILVNNASLFEERDNSHFLKIDFIQEVREEILKFGKFSEKELEEHKTDEHYTIFDLHDDATYEQIVNKIYEVGKELQLKFNFEKTTLTHQIPSDVDVLQRCKINILSIGKKFNFPLKFTYFCQQCNTKTEDISPLDVIGNKGKLICVNNYIYIDAEGKEHNKKCGNILHPSEELSLMKTAFYYDISYHDDKTQCIVSGISFLNLWPGYYDCVLVKYNIAKQHEQFIILDYKPFEKKHFQLPEKEEGRNYVYTLVDGCDKHIKENTKLSIFGLYPIKVALILQKATKYLGMRLLNNCMLCGSASTGKTTILKYYGYMMENFFHYTTNGQSTSIAGLRGTKEMINIYGTERKVINLGMLGTYHTLHIDEAGDNRELIQNMKTFLHEDNYSYDKAGGSGGKQNERTTHINLSENLNIAHSGLYRGSIKKAYNDDMVKIGMDEKPTWDENWDIYKPLFAYDDNLYLRKVIAEKRLEMQQKHIFWIDGYDYALHERFPFYFYLVNEKDSNSLKKIIIENSGDDRISKNFELMEALKNDDLDNFFESVKVFRDTHTIINDMGKVSDVVDEYRLHPDARTLEFYFTIAKLSKLINKRTELNDEDLNFIRYIIENTNCKIDVSDTNIIDVKGVKTDENKEKEIVKKIEESKEFDKQFGLPFDEFK